MQAHIHIRKNITYSGTLLQGTRQEGKAIFKGKNFQSYKSFSYLFLYWLQENFSLWERLGRSHEIPWSKVNSQVTFDYEIKLTTPHKLIYIPIIGKYSKNENLKNWGWIFAIGAFLRALGPVPWGPPGPHETQSLKFSLEFDVSFRNQYAKF